MTFALFPTALSLAGPFT